MSLGLYDSYFFLFSFSKWKDRVGSVMALLFIKFFSSPVVHCYFRQVIDPDTTKSSNIGHSLTGVMTRGKYMHMLSSKDLAPTDYRFELK